MNVRYWAMENISKLTDASGLIKALFDEDCAPSLRTVREWTHRRVVPFVKVGRLVFFSPTDVRQALAASRTVHGQAASARRKATRSSLAAARDSVHER